MQTDAAPEAAPEAAAEPLPPSKAARYCEKHPEIELQELYIPQLKRHEDTCPECFLEEVDRRALDDQRREAQLQAQRVAEQRQAELERRVGAAGIPERFRAFSFETFPTPTDAHIHALNTARSYANKWERMQSQGVSVLLVGPTGTGKTGLACAIGNSVLQHKAATVLFTTAYGAVRHQRDTWSRRGKTEREALDDLLSPDLLILDEVGASVGTDTELAMLFEVINGRYAAKRPTILLSNLPIEDYHVAGATRPGLRTFLGPRVIERFSDDGSFTLALSGASLRGPARRSSDAPSRSELKD